MKRFITMLMVAVWLLGAVNAYADDPTNKIGIDLHNGNTSDNDNTNNNSNKNTNKNDNNSGANAVVSSQREHVTALPGTVGNFVQGMPLPVPPGCIAIQGGSLTTEQIGMMADSGSVFGKKGGFWHMFDRRVHSTPYVRFDGDPDDKPVTFLQWSPQTDTFPIGSYLAESRCEGDYGYPMGSPLGKCALELKELVNANQVYACFTLRLDPSASGVSYGGGVTGSAINGGGNDNIAGSVSVGALLGTTTGYFNKAYDVYMFALSSAPLTPKPPAKEMRPVPRACNPSIFIEEYNKVVARIANCWRYSHGNMSDQLKAAKYCYAAFICNGRLSKDLPQLDIVIQHLYMAELNYIHGYDIREHADSAEIIKEVEYYLASAIYERFNSDANFWVAPERVKHVNKKTGADKWVKLTKSEWVQIYAIRRTLERRSERLEVIF